MAQFDIQRFQTVEHAYIKARFDLVVEGRFSIRMIKLLRGTNGFGLSMPSYASKRTPGKFIPFVYLLDKELYRAVVEEAKKMYEKTTAAP